MGWYCTAVSREVGRGGEGEGGAGWGEPGGVGRGKGRWGGVGQGRVRRGRAGVGGRDGVGLVVMRGPPACVHSREGAVETSVGG